MNTKGEVMRKGIGKTTGRSYRIVLDAGRLWIEYAMGADKWLRVVDREFLTTTEAVERVQEREAEINGKAKTS